MKILHNGINFLLLTYCSDNSCLGEKDFISKLPHIVRTYSLIEARDGSNER